MTKLYGVSLKMQEKEIDAYCFSKCGKLLLGGLDIMGSAFLLCKTDDCPYLDKSIDMGEADIPYDGTVNLVIRRLKDCDNTSDRI